MDPFRTIVTGKRVKVARLEDEWYVDVDDPAALIAALQAKPETPDVLSFWQRLPDTEPRHSYRMERDAIAALPLTTYEEWEKKIGSKTRNMVRRGEKKGVVVRRTEFDDEFVRGMTEIFNESPIRQGKPFWHYGKTFDTLKRDFSRFLFREEILGAYVGTELIGFIMLADGGRYALLGQIISKISHRDKAPNNLLMAKAVERCVERGFPYLVYAKWEDGTLGEFKQHNGFQRVELPRYHVPLTLKGRVFLGLKLQHGVSGLLPKPVFRVAKRLRRKVNEFIHPQAKTASAAPADAGKSTEGETKPNDS